MTQKELIDALIEDMDRFGETFLGTAEVQGEKVCKLYRRLNKEVGKRYPGMVVCWDNKTGMAWIA